MTWQDAASDPWLYATVALGLSVLLTLVPLVIKFTKKVDLNAVKPWFDDSDAPGDQKGRVIDNFERIRGGYTCLLEEQRSSLQRIRRRQGSLEHCVLCDFARTRPGVRSNEDICERVFHISYRMDGGLVTYAYSQSGTELSGIQGYRI